MKKVHFGIWAIMAVCVFPLSLPAADAWHWVGDAGDADWCTSMNWSGRKVPLGGDTAIFRSEGSVYTNIILTCNTTVARVRLASSATTPRIVKIGPGETSDRTLTINGAAEALTDENAGAIPGVDLTFSGELNGNGYRLKMRNNSSQPWQVLSTGSSLLVNCDVSGSSGIYKTGVGTVFLGGNNSFGGDNIISAGRVILGHPYALGLGGFNPGALVPMTVVSNITTLDLAGQTNINEVIALNGVGLGFLGGAMINSSNALASIAGGVVSSISVLNGGSGYSYPVTASVTGGGGSGATATAELGLSNDSITLTSGGVGYTTPPTVYFFGGGGSGAHAVALVDTNTTAVTNITVTAPGSGYSSAPLVVLAGGDGVEAEAVANDTNFTIVGTTLLTPGSGYTSPPTVNFSGGGTATAIANLASVILSTATTIGGSGPLKIDSAVSGAGALIKRGTSSLVLNGVNTYSGGTVVGGGTLLANNSGGSGTGTGAVTVTNGVFGGNGSISGPVSVFSGGSIAAGSSPGILTLAGGLNLSGGGTNVWELLNFKDDSNGVAGTDFDRLALTGGSLDLSGNSQLLLKFIGLASAPYSTETFWQTNHTWTILTVTPPGANVTNLPFANIVNGVYNAGSFSNYVATGGKIVLTYTANPPSKPVITGQPQNVTTNWGRPAAFNVTATGSDPFSYQWYFQNLAGAIPGATNNFYSNTNVQPENAGNYFVIITNTLGGATSDVAVLTVVITPPAAIQPLSFVGTGTTNVLVAWDAVVGGTYQLQYNTNLNTTNWFVVSNLVATGTSVTVSHRRLVKDPQRFYRVIGK